MVDAIIPYYEETYNFLKDLKPNTTLSMLAKTTYTYHGDQYNVSDDIVRDTGMVYKNLVENNIPFDLGRVRCWFTTHNRLVNAYIQSLPDFELKVNEDFMAIDGLSAIDAKWTLELPKNNATLKYWGKVLNFCVGGYGAYINKDQSIIIGVYMAGIIKYCIEYVPDSFMGMYHLHQFYGYGNSHPPQDLKAEIAEEIEKSLIV